LLVSICPEVLVPTNGWLIDENKNDSCKRLRHQAETKLDTQQKFCCNQINLSRLPKPHGRCLHTTLTHHAAAEEGVQWWQAVRLPSQQIKHCRP
jgi:hypothetical protein